MIVSETHSFVAMTAVLVSAVGIAQSYAGLCGIRFQQRRPKRRSTSVPGVTIFKPLCGSEPLLEEALETFFCQDYPRFQIVFGVHDATDPACRVVDRLRSRFPDVDVTLVSSPALHGRNRKISNLLNCQSAAKHDFLIVADSDVHVDADYLHTVLAELEVCETGLVTASYRGLVADPSLAARFARHHIDFSFLPSVLLGRILGRQDCLGATMAIRRETLEKIGGFEVLGDHLADDNMLGRLVVATGKRVALMPGLVAITVPEASWREVFDHELRWGRTIRTAAPVGYACSFIQYPLAWTVIILVISGLAWWSIALMLAVLVARALIADRIALAIGGSSPLGALLLVPRDLMSVTVIIASFCGSHVNWRGSKIDIRSKPGPRSADRQAASLGHDATFAGWFKKKVDIDTRRN